MAEPPLFRPRALVRSLVAVLLGNAVYFALLPFLPLRARHQPYRIDWGMGVDFWFCLAVWGLLGLAPWFRKNQ